MNINKPPGWLRRLYFSFNWKVKTRGKYIYLTFDDGPTPEVTHWVLQQLKNHHAKATFFCIGRNVERHPEIYQSIIDDGHSVGNHTYSHLNGWKTKYREYINDVELCSQFVHSRLFRPPYGKIGQMQTRFLKKQGYKLFMWDVLSEDYNRELSEEDCWNNVVENTERGSIVVLHDSVKAKGNLYAVLPKILQHYKEKGFVFKRLK